jgi:hypothetical protein
MNAAPFMWPTTFTTPATGPPRTYREDNDRPGERSPFTIATGGPFRWFRPVTGHPFLPIGTARPDDHSRNGSSSDHRRTIITATNALVGMGNGRDPHHHSDGSGRRHREAATQRGPRSGPGLRLRLPRWRSPVPPGMVATAEVIAFRSMERLIGLGPTSNEQDPESSCRGSFRK